MTIDKFSSATGGTAHAQGTGALPARPAQPAPPAPQAEVGSLAQPDQLAAGQLPAHPMDPLAAKPIMGNAKDAVLGLQDAIDDVTKWA